MAVSGHSMEPTLRAGDWVFVIPFSAPRVGDVVVVRNPVDRDDLMLKRVARVDDDAVFVAGDNVEDSLDSRQLGLIPRRDVVGRAAFRYAPLARFGAIGRG